MTDLTIYSKLRMNSGYDIPVLGYGDHDMSISSLYFPRPAAEVEALVAHALAKGYRHVDSAASYHNEGPCGKAIRESGIPREDIFFTSKIPPRKMGYEKAKAQVDTTLKETGLDYIDLMLIHAPYGGRQARKGVWKALVEAQEQGKVRSLGISNYGAHHLDEMEIYMNELEAERGQGKGGVVAVGQWELHPWLDHSDIVQWCRKRGVVIEAWSPLVRGERMNEKVLEPLIGNHKKSAAQVLLRWSLQQGYVPLPKSINPRRIDENADIFDFELTAEEMKTLETGQYAPCSWDPTVSHD